MLMNLTYLKKDFDTRSPVPIVSPSPPMATRSSSNGERRTQLENPHSSNLRIQPAPHGMASTAKHHPPTTDVDGQQGRMGRVSK